MKEILLKIWTFLISVYLQMILGFIAFLSWNEAYDFGNKKITFSKIGERLSSYGGFGRVRGGSPDVTPASEDVAVAVTSGYDGGALAMGLITCACIIGIVWLEVNKIRKSK